MGLKSIQNSGNHWLQVDVNGLQREGVTSYIGFLLEGEEEEEEEEEEARVMQSEDTLTARRRCTNLSKQRRLSNILNSAEFFICYE